MRPRSRPAGRPRGKPRTHEPRPDAERGFAVAGPEGASSRLTNVARERRYVAFWVISRPNAFISGRSVVTPLSGHEPACLGESALCPETDVGTHPNKLLPE
jgi:hypothetical protein